MAKFLNTTGTTYLLEELIKNAKEKLILVSPYLQFNSRIKELIEDKNNLKIDVRIIYGKSKLKHEETEWLNGLKYVRLGYCDNLHAKCYLNEDSCIITSLNLYEFSQVNNNEAGVLLTKEDDFQAYSEAQEEIRRFIRISKEDEPIPTNPSPAKEERKISPQQPEYPPKKKVEPKEEKPKSSFVGKFKDKFSRKEESAYSYEKLTAAKLAEKNKMKTKDLMSLLTLEGFFEFNNAKHYLTQKGKDAGIQAKKGDFVWYFLFPGEFDIEGLLK